MHLHLRDKVGRLPLKTFQEESDDGKSKSYMILFVQVFVAKFDFERKHPNEVCLNVNPNTLLVVY